VKHDSKAIVNLANFVVNNIIVDKNSMHKIFSVSSDVTQETIVDTIKMQYQYLCVESVPEPEVSAVKFWQNAALIKD
jgi:hypothetical protein